MVSDPSCLLEFGLIKSQKFRLCQKVILIFKKGFQFEIHVLLITDPDFV